MPQVGSPDPGEADREGGRYNTGLAGDTDVQESLRSSNLLCFQLLTPQTGKGVREAAPFWRQKELICEQPQHSEKSPGRQTQRATGFRLSKKKLPHALMPRYLPLLNSEMECLLSWLCFGSGK